tara:strand:- start:1356 stop:1844 length:489 start_codon:yes stop_codon:yes gene_type:complete
MKNILTSIALLFTLNSFSYGHCQVPCGIYNDVVRIVQIKEDITTMWKAMNQINSLSGKTDSQSMNQLVRWVTTKESHAKNIQNTVTEYFLAQRIKPKNKGEEGRQKYVNQTLLMQQVIVSAMKCKQTVDPLHCEKITELLEQFSKIYLDEHGFNHLESLEKN